MGARLSLSLTPFAPSHFDTLASWFHSEREAVQWGGPLLSYPIPTSTLQSMIDPVGGDRPGREAWMALDADGGCVGHAQLIYDWRNGNAILARVAIAPDRRGQGLAQPMLSLVLARGFARPDLERVELNVFAWNTPALRAYLALGFVVEGMRRSYVRVGEERWDTTLMGLLRRDWKPDAV